MIHKKNYSKNHKAFFIFSFMLMIYFMPYNSYCQKNDKHNSLEKVEESILLNTKKIEMGGALGHASSALTTIDKLEYKNIKTDWATNVKMSRSYDKFVFELDNNASGKLYLILAQNDLTFSSALQIKDFTNSGSAKKGYKTLEVSDETSKNEPFTVTITKDNSNNTLYKLKDSIGLNYRIYMAYESANGNLEKDIVNESISLIQEFQSLELSNPINPPYAYTIGFPIEYFDKNIHKKFPVIINLHGAGGGKEGAAGMKVFKSPRQNGYSCIVVSPASGGGAWKIKKLNELIEHIKKEYSEIVDDKRIYFMGFSMGGHGVWDLSMKHANKIAAAVVNSGGFRGKTDLSDMDFSLMKDLPFWAVHNCDDSVAEITIGWAPINELVAVGGKPKFLINIASNPDFPNQDKNNKHTDVFAADYRNLVGSRKGHKLNGKYFYNQEFYKWLFSQTR